MYNVHFLFFFIKPMKIHHLKCCVDFSANHNQVVCKIYTFSMNCSILCNIKDKSRWGIDENEKLKNFTCEVESKYPELCPCIKELLSIDPF